MQLQKNWVQFIDQFLHFYLMFSLFFSINMLHYAIGLSINSATFTWIPISTLIITCLASTLTLSTLPTVKPSETLIFAWWNHWPSSKVISCNLLNAFQQHLLIVVKYWHTLYDYCAGISVHFLMRWLWILFYSNKKKNLMKHKIY